MIDAEALLMINTTVNKRSTAIFEKALSLLRGKKKNVFLISASLIWLISDVLLITHFVKLNISNGGSMARVKQIQLLLSRVFLFNVLLVLLLLLLCLNNSQL